MLYSGRTFRLELLERRCPATNESKTWFDFPESFLLHCSRWIVDEPQSFQDGVTYSTQREDMMSELFETLLGLATPLFLAAPKKKAAKKVAKKKAAPKKRSVKKPAPKPVAPPPPPPPPPPAAPMPPPAPINP